MISPIATDNLSTVFSAGHLARTPATMTFASIKHRRKISDFDARVCSQCITSSPAHAIIRIVRDVSVDESKMSTKLSVVAGFKHKRHIWFVFDLWLSLSSVAARFVAIVPHSVHQALNEFNGSNEQRSLSVRFSKSVIFDLIAVFIICNFYSVHVKCTMIDAMSALASSFQSTQWTYWIENCTKMATERHFFLIFGGICQRRRPNVKRVLRVESQRIRGFYIWIGKI